MENKGDSRSGIQAILFDLDNTVIATRHADKLACNKIVEILTQTYGIPTETSKHICKSFLNEFRKCPENLNVHLDVWRHQLWYQALPSPYREYSDDIYRRWLDYRFYYLQVSHEIVELLKKLRRNYLLGLITNGPSNSQWEKISNLKLESFFDIILVSGDLPWEKPQEEIFRMAYEYLGVKSENCIMVGDKLETDIMGGIQAQLGGTVYVPLKAMESHTICEPHPDFVIGNVTELPKVLKNGYKSPKLRRKSKDFLHPYKFKIFSDPDLSDCNSNGSDGS